MHIYSFEFVPLYLRNLGDFKSRYMKSIILLYYSCLMLLVGGLPPRLTSWQQTYLTLT